MSSSWMFYILILIATLIETFSDVLLKKWALQATVGFLILGLLGYALGTFFWGWSLKYQYLSKAVAIFMLINLVGTVLVGVFYFGETLSVANKMGLLLAVVSILLIELG